MHPRWVLGMGSSSGGLGLGFMARVWLARVVGLGSVARVWFGIRVHGGRVRYSIQIQIQGQGQGLF